MEVINVNQPEITEDFIKTIAKLIGAYYDRQIKNKNKGTHKILHK